MQNYLKKHGARKCEANAVIPIHKEARKLCKAAIEKYLGDDAPDRFEKRADDRDAEFDEIREKIGLMKHIKKAVKALNDYDG